MELIVETRKNSKKRKDREQLFFIDIYIQKREKEKKRREKRRIRGQKER